MVERKAVARKAPAAKAKPTAPPPSADADGSGVVGDLPDETPNEHYTLSGVLKGLPVPEHEKPVG